MQKIYWLPKMIAFYEEGIKYCEKNGWTDDNMMLKSINGGLCSASYNIKGSYNSPARLFPDHPFFENYTRWWDEFGDRQGALIRYTFLLLEWQALKT